MKQSDPNDSNQLGEEIRSFLRHHIFSCEQLETLLLVRDRRDDAWTDAATVGRELAISTRAAEEALDQLCRGNLLDIRVGEHSVIFRYSPGTAELESLVDRLALVYREKRLQIIGLIDRNAVDRVSTAAIRTFADAFLLRRRKKDG